MTSSTSLTQTLFFKIVMLFVFAMLSFFAFSYYFIKDHSDKEAKIQEIRYQQVATTINAIVRSNGTMEDIEEYLKDLGFEAIRDENTQNFLAAQNRMPLGFMGMNAKGINTSKGIFILLETPISAVLYRSKTPSNHNNFYIIVFGGIMILCFMFAFILKSLLPIKRLQKEIRKFGSGDLDINCPIRANDEIGELSKEFNKAAKTIKSLNTSRTLFLRSIMHELRTPITKGRIIAEMIESKLYKERLCRVFSRLNSLIDEFAKIEQMSAKSYKVKKIEFLAHDLIRYCESMLLIEKDSPVMLLSPSAVIKADFDLLSMGVKNMLDNAIKYGTPMDDVIKGKEIMVKVYVTKDTLYIANKGAALKMDLEEYFKPYFKPDVISKDSGGLGLGMYIIKNTLSSQGFWLGYEHKDGENIFSIKGCVVENYCDIEDRIKVLKRNIEKIQNKESNLK